MTPEEVAASYDQIASRWAGPTFNRANGIEAHRRALKFFAGHGVALDVGCGSSGRFIDLLQGEGFEVEGLDLSAEMLRLARERHPNVRFHHADVRTWQAPRRYSFITAWDSIWHVPLADQLSVVAKLCGLLEPGGVFLFTAGGLEEPSDVRDAHMGVPMYTATAGIPNLLAALQENGCACRHLEYDQWPELHVVFLAQKVSS